MLLKKKGALLASILILNSWVGAVLADNPASGALSVQAKVTPAGCKITFDNSELDFGSVNPGEIKKLATNLNIVCDKNMSAKISFSDPNFDVEKSNTYAAKFTLIDPKTKAKNETIPFSDPNFDVEESNTFAARFAVIDQKTKTKNGTFSLKVNPLNNDLSEFIVSRNGESGNWRMINSKSNLHPKNSTGNNQYLSMGNLGDWKSDFKPVPLKNLNIPLEVVLKIDKTTAVTEQENFEGKVIVLFEYT